MKRIKKTKKQHNEVCDFASFGSFRKPVLPRFYCMGVFMDCMLKKATKYTFFIFSMEFTSSIIQTPKNEKSQ